MPATAVLEYPEFLLAALIGVFLVAFGGKSRAMQLPNWLSAPAVSVLASMPGNYISWLLRYQNWAGYRSNSAFGTLASAKVYTAIFFVLSALVMPFVAALPLVLVSFFLPDAVLYVSAKRRQKQIRESLPQALDLMVLCVDAGLGLDATLQRISQEQTALANALNEELLTLGRDILLGMDRERAYQELFNRTGVDELRSLGSSLNQSAKLGLSIAKILRSQSEFLRMKLSQKAEEKAAKLPIYMAFPLWFCIMPALLVILLAPSLIMFFEQVGFGMFK